MRFAQGERPALLCLGGGKGASAVRPGSRKETRARTLTTTASFESPASGKPPTPPSPTPDTTPFDVCVTGHQFAELFGNQRPGTSDRAFVETEVPIPKLKAGCGRVDCCSHAPHRLAGNVSGRGRRAAVVRPDAKSAERIAAVTGVAPLQLKDLTLGVPTDGART